jgi:AhpD family alkylhydroperoxidase
LSACREDSKVFHLRISERAAMIVWEGAGMIRSVLSLIENKIVAQGFRHIKHIRAVPVEEATGLVAEVYYQLARDFQILPPATIHSPVPELLAAVWCMLRETLLAGRVPRPLKEGVALGVSEANACPYCVEAHTLMLRDVGGSVHSLLIDSRGNRLAELARWANQTPQPGESMPTPCEHCDVPEIIGTAVAFHYFNRVVNVFLDKSPLPVPSGLQWTKRFLRRVATETLGKRIGRIAVFPGDSLRLLPPAELPRDFRWTRSNCLVAETFARTARVMDEVGFRVIPAGVRTLVTTQLERWNGEHPGLDRTWAVKATGSLEESERPLATLLLLTAIASYQVDARFVAAARASFRDEAARDSHLIGAVAWAAFSAARVVGTWMGARDGTSMQARRYPSSAL